ncbi:MAG: pimeloyl-CoA dehydrogenase small subunit [Burkholderiaceae bacterium]|nr:pimeloyl-CoA dehydrogenase small subunit [Burkholderiaceae bacterium]
MDFELSDEQRQLADSLERLLAQQYDIEQRRAIIASADGFSAAMWARFAELGILGLPVSEQAGGFGGGAVDLMRPMALLGDALVVEPVLAQLVAARLLDRSLPAGDGDSRKAAGDALQGAITGERRIAWARASAHDDGPCSATRDGDGWLLEGRCTGVTGGAGADWLLVETGSGGPADEADAAVFLLPASTPGIELRAVRALDDQRVADLRIGGVRAQAAQRLASGKAAREALEDAGDFASALLAAEAVGLVDFACRTTLEYLKTRKQFGTTIGSFQALQHRIVDLFVELEQVRSVAALACSKVDAAAAGQVSAAERAKAVAAARVLVGKAADKVAQESVQLHGGMGMAEELKISHTFKRLTMLARQFGDVDHFIDRFVAADRQLGDSAGG